MADRSTRSNPNLLEVENISKLPTKTQRELQRLGISDQTNVEESPMSKRTNLPQFQNLSTEVQSDTEIVTQGKTLKDKVGTRSDGDCLLYTSPSPRDS